MRGLIAALLLSAIAADVAWATELKPEEVPTFKVRLRVVSVGGESPEGKQFSLRYGVISEPVMAEGQAWSEWIAFARPQVEATLGTYPASYLDRWPVVVRLNINAVVDPTVVEGELKFDGSDQVVPLAGELYGPNLGVLVWRDEQNRPQAATMAQYNRRYWQALAMVDIPAAHRPRKFPIVDRFIGGDDDRRAWREGIEQLDRAGFSAIMLPPDTRIRELLLATGRRRTAWAVYSPPGYAFDFDAEITPDSIQKWADAQARPYAEAGYDRQDMSLFAMSDEPGWYYPATHDSLQKSPAALTRFREYLAAQGLQPQDFGAQQWDQVQPSSERMAEALPERRRFYWTIRFFAHDSARHFAVSTRALERAFYPGMPILTNWNFFNGRLYVPGPVANNSAKENPQAGMGGHDWLEFGRMRGGTMLWTEDWFGDSQAYQWSFYCAKLRCAAEKGGVEFGGYVIPRTAGDREDGVLQKIMAVVGSGGKAIKYFVFGPEYNFPSNCYSERSHVLPKMAEAHAMIGAAEELLWPGKRPRPQVAILAPRSAQLWDAREVEIPTMISDATNGNLNGATVDYMAEVFNLYLALQHANVPVDFVEEGDLSPEGLQAYRVLYVTEPNLPAENQQGLAAWVRGGGTLVTGAGAAQRDRYDEPCSILADATDIQAAAHKRLLVADTKSLPDVARGDGAQGSFTAVGVRSSVEAADENVVGRFDDEAPAVIERPVGSGRAIHFAWMPGLSYWKSSQTTRDKLPVDFSPTIRQWIVWPTQLSGVKPPVVVDQPLVETPLLVSEGGAAVTLLNWTGAPIESLALTVHVPFPVASVESIRHGRLDFQPTPDGLKLALPLNSTDVLLLRK